MQSIRQLVCGQVYVFVGRKQLKKKGIENRFDWKEDESLVSNCCSISKDMCEQMTLSEEKTSGVCN